MSNPAYTRPVFIQVPKGSLDVCDCQAKPLPREAITLELWLTRKLENMAREIEEIRQVLDPNRETR